MLKSLSIKNIALISQLTLNLENGLNILSGETGAGKSIIIDSLNFVLGERADKTLIRYGTDEASVQAIFEDYETEDISSYLDNIDIEKEDVLIISRKMRDSKNECRINGKQVTLSMLKGLTSLLVDIHGQHEHQTLLNESNHIKLIDAIGQDNILKIKNNLSKIHEEYTYIKSELKKYGNEEDRLRKLDLLQYQIEEIKKANLQLNEEEELIEKRHKLRNSEKIINALKESNELLDGYESTSVTSEIKRTISFLNSISTFDKHINSLIERLDSTKLEIKDISETLYDMLSSIDISEAESNKIDERINLVRQLKRKYGQTEEDVFNYLEKCEKEYELLSNSSAKVAEFQSQLEKKGKELISIAITLSKQRQIISKTLESNLLLNLKDLGMNDTLFKVEFSTPEIITADDVGIDGADSLEFLISPNIGEPLKPLSKIISGGEMSRFMLALKNIIADKDSISTMVFDEIDTGISGNIMTAVAMKMCRISRNHQVIAVTHMPSLAAMADVHFLIEKNVEEDKTITHVYPLDDEGDIKEIGRLIGGLNYSNYALPHAQEMKNWANDYKKTL